MKEKKDEWGENLIGGITREKPGKDLPRWKKRDYSSGEKMGAT